MVVSVVVALIDVGDDYFVVDIVGGLFPVVGEAEGFFVCVGVGDAAGEAFFGVGFVEEFFGGGLDVVCAGYIILDFLSEVGGECPEAFGVEGWEGVEVGGPFGVELVFELGDGFGGVVGGGEGDVVFFHFG